MTGTAADPTSQVAEKLRELADEHYDNSDLNSALLLGADLIEFQGNKIDVQSKQLELLGLENEELRAQIAIVKDLLARQRKTLETMPVNDRALFRAFQVFIAFCMCHKQVEYVSSPEQIAIRPSPSRRQTSRLR